MSTGGVRIDLPKEEIIRRYKSGDTTAEIAERFDCGSEVIRTRLEEWGIERRSKAEIQSYDVDKDEVVEKYKSGETSYEIADHFDCSYVTVLRWLEEEGVERRDSHEYLTQDIPYFHTHRQGYERWASVEGGKKKYLPVHRLLAISEYGVEAVKDSHVHHKNNIPWDNRIENLKVMEPSEHLSMHNIGNERWKNRERDDKGRFT